MRPLVSLTALSTAVLALTACGGGPDTAGERPAASAASPTKHNFQDVVFAQGMIPHHQQAVDVAEIALLRSRTPQVRQLATAIKRGMTPEITAMTGWLNSWGATVPATDASDGTGHGLADMGDIGNGMMSRTEVARLRKLSGALFDRTYLTLMIKHHQGSLLTARAEQSQGQAGEAKALAADLIRNHTAEIAKMQALLKRG